MPTDSGRPHRVFRCPDCGTAVWSEYGGLTQAALRPRRHARRSDGAAAGRAHLHALEAAVDHAARRACRRSRRTTARARYGRRKAWHGARRCSASPPSAVARRFAGFAAFALPFLRAAVFLVRHASAWRALAPAVRSPPCPGRTSPTDRPPPAPCRRPARLRHRQRLVDAGHQILLVDRAQAEQQFGLRVQPRADAVQHRRDVLAHRRIVRATAREADLLRLREQPETLAADALHHALRQPALQQLDQRIDPAGAVLADRPPLRRRHRVDARP